MNSRKYSPVADYYIFYRSAIKKFLIAIFIFLTLCVGWYCGSVSWYLHWFETNLIGTIWTPSKEKELTEIIGQTYHFCGQGSTSKAYASEDGRFVIKTFIKKRIKTKKCRHIPFVRNLLNKRNELRIKYKRCLGPIHAYQYIPKESGLIFYQFVKQRKFFGSKIRLVEKNGSVTELDLDKDEYVIQKKAVIVSEYLKSLIAKGDLAKAKEGISKLLRMTKTLYDQGIVLVVLQFLDNFGFIDDEPIRIDVEHLRFDPNWKENGKIHLKKQLSHFRSWVVKNAPQEVVDHFDLERDQISKT